MIDILKTVYAATDEYEMRYGKHPTLFINKPFYNALMVETKLYRDQLYIGLDNMLLCGYPVKLVIDDSKEMHFWVGEQRPIYGKGELTNEY